MTDDAEKRLANVEQRLAAAEHELVKWKNLQVALESGGGRVVIGTDAVFLVINALTPSSAQTP
jgi:hypothetical protein